MRERVAGVELVAAIDVRAPLLGMFGAARTFGPQKGMDDEQIWRVDRLLDGFVDAVCGSAPSQRRTAEVEGAGAAGGLGFALAVLGAVLVPGTQVVLDAIGIDAHVAAADLVVTGEGAYDITSRSGKTVFGVAEAAARQARPCIVLAGRVDVGAREMRAMGVESAYAVVDVVGRRRRSATRPPTWRRSPSGSPARGRPRPEVRRVRWTGAGTESCEARLTRSTPRTRPQEMT